VVLKPQGLFTEIVGVVLEASGTLCGCLLLSAGPLLWYCSSLPAGLCSFFGGSPGHSVSGALLQKLAAGCASVLRLGVCLFLPLLLFVVIPHFVGSFVF
jgi:hypothetical protein